MVALRHCEKTKRCRSFVRIVANEPMHLPEPFFPSKMPLLPSRDCPDHAEIPSNSAVDCNSSQATTPVMFPSSGLVPPLLLIYFSRSTWHSDNAALDMDIVSKAAAYLRKRGPRPHHNSEDFFRPTASSRLQHPTSNTYFEAPFNNMGD